MLRFVRESMPEILAQLSAAVAALAPGESVAFEVPDPDLSQTHYPGELLGDGPSSRVYRPLATWLDLAEALECALATPRACLETPDFIRLRFRKLAVRASWQSGALPSGHTERYGTASEFGRVDKLEEPRFLADYLASIRSMALPPDGRVLALGVNQGAELGVLTTLFGPDRLAQMSLVGVDHAGSVIEEARARYSAPCFRFVEADLADLEALDLGRFDLVVALNTLHSPAFDGRAVFRRVLSHHLRPGGAVLLGFPNCRYLDHSLVYGAQRKGVEGVELAVLLKEVKYYKRVLHQHGMDVKLFGKYTLLLSGRSIRSASPSGP